MRAPARLQGIQHWGTVVLPRAWLQPGIGAPAGVRAALVWGRDDAGAERAAGLRILMVEDDEALSQMYATRLRRDGHDVTTVGDGESGLKAALTGNFDLVFLDISLPRMDGISILEHMRQDQATADCPVVILSNYSEPPLLAKGKELGVRRYLVKSETSPAEIAASVRGWIAG